MIHLKIEKFQQSIEKEMGKNSLEEKKIGNRNYITTLKIKM